MSHGATLLHLRGAAGKDAIYRKIGWRLLPLLMLCYAVACLDRINISYARLQMQDGLAFSGQVYAWGVGLFFVGYCLFALPCNLLLEKIGARKTLLRIMLLWAAMTAAGAFVRSPLEFYIIRFMLGVFEAGCFPGVILYLTYWYPAARRARVIAVFASAALMAGALAGPLCNLTLQTLHLRQGLDGWQWLLLTQGLPAALLGVIAYFYLDDKPEDARWLSPFEQQIIEQDLERDEAMLAAASGQAANAGEEEDDDPPSAIDISWSLLRTPAIALLAVSNLLLLGASYALAFWAPTLMQRWGAAGQMSGLLIVLPSVAGVIGMIAIGYDSDRRRERRGHFIACMVLAAGGLAMAIAADNLLAWSLAGLSLASVGIAAAAPLLIAILTDLLNRRRAAAGIALVCSFGVLGAAFGPVLAERAMAWGGAAAMLAALIVLYVAAGVALLVALRLAPRRGGAASGNGHIDMIARS